MPTLSSSGSFNVVGQTSAVAEASTVVIPAVGFPSGLGRIVHPVLGAFDYAYKPDEWVNVDGGGAIVAPTWASTKTLQGSAHSLWTGSISDVVCEERWGVSQQGLSMPIAQLRMLMAIWMNPVDPTVGYVQWFPNYATNVGFNVLPVDLVVGRAGLSTLARLSGIGYQVISLDDVVNYLDAEGNNDGWVTQAVTFFMKLVSEVTVS